MERMRTPNVQPLLQVVVAVVPEVELEVVVEARPPLALPKPVLLVEAEEPLSSLKRWTHQRREEELRSRRI
jgi:hypothetical protein